MVRLSSSRLCTWHISDGVYQLKRPYNEGILKITYSAGKYTCSEVDLSNSLRADDKLEGIRLIKR